MKQLVRAAVDAVCEATLQNMSRAGREPAEPAGGKGSWLTLLEHSDILCCLLLVLLFSTFRPAFPNGGTVLNVSRRMTERTSGLR